MPKIKKINPFIYLYLTIFVTNKKKKKSENWAFNNENLS